MSASNYFLACSNSFLYRYASWWALYWLFCYCIQCVDWLSLNGAVDSCFRVFLCSLQCCLLAIILGSSFGWRWIMMFWCSSKKLHDDGGQWSRCVGGPGIIAKELFNWRLLLAVPNNSGIDKSIGTKFHCFTSMIG